MSGPAFPLTTLLDRPQWVAWRNELRGGKLTKVPYRAPGYWAKSDDPQTWIAHDHAAAVSEKIVNGAGGGVGIVLGRCGDFWLAGVDLDTCRDPQGGAIEAWAQDVITRFASYAEISPSGTGVKIFCLLDPADIAAAQALMGTPHGRQWKQADGSDHPPAIELHISGRYFTVTWARLESWPDELRVVALEDLRWLIEEAGPSFACNPQPKNRERRGGGDARRAILARLDTAARHNYAIAAALRHAATMRGGSRSEGALGLGAALRRTGWSYEDMKAALLACPATREWATEKLAEGERQFERIWEKAADRSGPQPNGPAGEQQQVADDEAEQAAIRDYLSVKTWIKRNIPAPDRLLGDFVTTTIRAFLAGHTGLGKTMLGLAIAMGMATGAGFLHWRSPRKARVLYIDGEMPAELIKTRCSDALRRLGPDIEIENLFIFGRDLEDEAARMFPTLGKFAPLNTEVGQNFMLALIAKLGGVDVVIFDNVQSLTVGDKKEEATWSDTMPLVILLTTKRIGQIWIDHTGHNTERMYGTATKGWSFDNVGIMTPLADDVPGAHGDIAFMLSFDQPHGKARRRTPENRGDFAAHIIRLKDDQWTSEPANKGANFGKIRPSREPFYDALVTAISKSADGPGRTTLDAWERECEHRGLIERAREGDTGVQRAARAAKYRTAKSDLLAAKWIAIEGDLVIDLKERWAGASDTKPADQPRGRSRSRLENATRA